MLSPEQAKEMKETTEASVVVLHNFLKENPYDGITDIDEQRFWTDIDTMYRQSVTFLGQLQADAAIQAAKAKKA